MRVRISCSLALLFLAPCGRAEQNPPLIAFHTSVAEAVTPDASPSLELTQSQNPHVKLFAATVQAAKWPTSSIPVCWENPSPAHAEAMAWTRDAVTRTWERASALRLTGWATCAALNNGIRIQIADEGPHVKTLGRLLNQQLHGMVLNFTFGNWSQSCQSNREHCIRAIAVHEFGHAIGFTHEQNRADAPGECRLLAQGTNPDTLLTPYDPTSVMNYCNKRWNNEGFLSALDISAAQALYGKP